MILRRFAHTRFGALGRLQVGGVELYTVELPWRGNERNESCIPPGRYNYQRHDSPRFGETLWLRDVPGRSEILFHVANSPADLDGCIGPGLDYGWWSDRGELAVWDSRTAMDELLAKCEDNGMIDIHTWTPEYP